MAAQCIGKIIVHCNNRLRYSIARYGVFDFCARYSIWSNTCEVQWGYWWVQLAFRIRRCRSRRFALCIRFHSISVAAGLDKLLTTNIPDPNFSSATVSSLVPLGFNVFNNHQTGNWVSHQNNLPEVFWCLTQCPKDRFIQCNLSLGLVKILPGVPFGYLMNSMTGLFWQSVAVYSRSRYLIDGEIFSIKN